MDELKKLNTELQERLAGDAAAIVFGDEITASINKAYAAGVTHGSVLAILHGMAFQVTRALVEEGENVH